ncbi:MAG: DUF4349 domain-containing protein, partial [Nocardioides sp.]
MNGSADGSVRRRTVGALVGGSLAAALVLAGCSGARSSSGAVDDTGGAPAYAVPSPSAKEPATGTAADAAGTVGQESGGRQAQPDLLTGRSVIRTAALTVRVDDVLASSARASTLAAAASGFVAGEQTQAAPDHPGKAEAVLTLRVPAARLPQLMTQLRGLGTLLAETQNAEDVTGQVIDVKARISAQRASVARIQALLARATTVGQVVQIEGELTSRQAALESLEGQAAALADQTSLATVTAT